MGRVIGVGGQAGQAGRWAEWLGKEKASGKGGVMGNRENESLEETNNHFQDPKYLYRYYAFPSEENINRIEEIFIERKLYFPSPAKFNDPFDSRVDSLNFEASPQKMEEYIRGMIKRRHPDWNRQRRKAYEKEIMKNKAYQKIDCEKMKKNFQEGVDGHGVLCLTRAPNNLLMWSHYTNGHRGYCLQFLNTVDFFARALKINYSDEPPILDAFFGEHEEVEIEKLLLTKPMCWEYEQEWRIYEIGGAGIRFTFPKGALTGVIFGCRMEERHKLFLSSLAAEMSKPPNIFQAERKGDKFGLEFYPIVVKSKINGEVVIPPVLDTLDP